MEDIYPSARDRLRGRPSDFISSIDALPPGTKVVLFCRVSGRAQSDNLPNQFAKLRSEAEGRQLEVVFEIDNVVSAIDGDTEGSFVLDSLESAALAALKHGATAIIACCTSVSVSFGTSCVGC